MKAIFRISRFSKLLSLLTLWFLMAGTTQAASPTIHFGTPPWPGLKVKTQVAETLLQALGYQTQAKKLGVPFIYRDLASGNLDAYLGGWMPTEKKMVDPLLADHKVTNLGSNLSGGVIGLAVPDYVWDDGIHSVQDLTDHAERFQSKIYGIESGSEINNAVSTAIKEDDEGMGQFNLVGSSTAVMLTQVKRAVSRHEPVVFIGWRPHWMNIDIKMRYLKGRKDSAVAGVKSHILTIVSNDLAENQPNVARFLSQVRIKTRTQSRWIYNYSYKKGDLETVAKNWLKTHPKTVKTWLEGVNTVDGSSGYQAYRKALNISG
ncbi:ABC transporter substrate-binding protein [Salinisphaera sp. SPP-AMP-43]|uniref:ABC transporter substrate-binding protein n=1 Tax=Salinisphaera sp. SPP-AMP-43 TaxID=3121288 RepID=UPI003C6DF3C0